MKRLAVQYRSMPPVTQLLLLNQLTINLGFYMLMPYLAQHLAGTLGLAAWLVGLVLGVRNLSQQGMFAVGGALADRFGYKPLIVAGCVLRTAGFGLLALADSLPGLIIALAATGLAGALFNPAVRAYLAVDAGPKRVEAFALFNVFYQTGILAGPLVGLALTGINFRLTCAVAAAVFAILAVIQIRALPPQRSIDKDPRESLMAQWRSVVANRPFLLFASAMVCSYVLSFQVYLALPLEVRRLPGDGADETFVVAALFAVSGLVTVLGQTRVTAWCRAHLQSGQVLVLGTATMGCAFVPLALAAVVPQPTRNPGQWLIIVLPPLTAAAMLAVGTMIAFPFEMDTIVELSEGRLVATHYGIYNTICGFGITAGNLLTGAALDAARSAPVLPWLVLIALGLLSAGMLSVLQRKGRLSRTNATVS
ncbi:MFS transporter [Kribbella sp. DT2]|uniref:MFS transporter n=1 Tax=Kribbella sp. DT2 TaxID=3393427 RepID=UPI003CEA70A2